MKGNSLRIRGFVLGVVLLALVGWCMVQESVKQTNARYQLADLSRRETDIRKNLIRLQAEEERLRSPARLAAIVRDKKLALVSLGSATPSETNAPGDANAANRRPGEVLDGDFAKSERLVNVASAGGW